MGGSAGPHRALARPPDVRGASAHRRVRIARLGLGVLPAHATRGKGGVASDWLCMWREGVLGPAPINIVASLCADARFFGSALRMGGLAAGFLFLLGADWSGALIRTGVAGPWRLVPSHTTAFCVGWGRGRCTRVMWGAL